MDQVEAFEEVERAFVHVDYLRRDEPEHKVDYNLLHQRQNLLEPHESLQDSLASGSMHSKSLGQRDSDRCNGSNEVHDNDHHSPRDRTDVV